MAVYDRAYRPYAGAQTAAWSRFTVLPRYSYEHVFRSRPFIAFAVLCSFFPLASAVVIYLHHNLTALTMLHLEKSMVDQQLPINGFFFTIVLFVQCFLAFFLALFMGTSLIAPDLNNNGLALYLSRPFSKWEYILGRFMTLAALMSLITWVPGLLLFLFQAYLEGWAWFSSNLFIAGAVFAGSWIWIVLITLLTMASSAWVRRKPLAAGMVVGVFFVLFAMSRAINLVYQTEWGDLLNLGGLTRTAWAGMFGTTPPTEIPLGIAWIALLAFCGIFLWLLTRKVKAYQVVR
jgi:ABC-2 type transport system permease protein